MVIVLHCALGCFSAVKTLVFDDYMKNKQTLPDYFLFEVFCAKSICAMGGADDDRVPILRSSTN